ncbi:hypothetical protein DFH07DRAFT_1060615 [Mycena maculata]|uniref:Uncharacterized protein n=1 Tax=Mycena maculata TaxID=230809 RepID=A0AAD7NED4_9AGAR|nr:hypothetical protein DFH07DRAFT_1060615 [Mycena maculata]
MVISNIAPPIRTRAPLAAQLVLQLGIPIQPFIPGAPQAYESSFDAGLTANIICHFDPPHAAVNPHDATPGSHVVDTVPDLTDDAAAAFSPERTPSDIRQLTGSPGTSFTTFVTPSHSSPTVNSADDEGPDDTKPLAVPANDDGRHTQLVADMRRNLKGVNSVALDTPPDISKPLCAYTASAIRNLDALEVLWKSRGAAGENESMKGIIA